MKRRTPGQRILAFLAGALLLGTSAPAVMGDEPTAAPAPERRSCAERYPANGPAGVDLQLGCVAAEIISSYTGATRSTEPARISAWLGPMAAFAGVLLALWLLVPMATRRFGRRMAPTTPSSWWSCPGCRSLNGENVTRCYACGRPWTADAMTLASPEAPPREGTVRSGPSGTQDPPEG